MMRDFTWQDAINVLQILAIKRGTTTQDLAGRIRFWRGFSNAVRNEPYTGKPLSEWNLSADEMVLAVAILSKSTVEIITCVGQAERGEWDKIITPPPPSHEPTKFYCGLHFAADGIARDSDIKAAKCAGMNAALVLAHTPADFYYKISAELGGLVLVRPFWSDGDGDFYNRTRQDIANWYAVGARWFVFPNEPNLYPHEGLYTNWANGAELAYHFIRFAKQARKEFRDIKFVFGNLSPHHDIDSGGVKIADFRKFWDECASAGVLEYVDAVGIHVYWQTAEQIEQDYFGGHWRWWLDKIPADKQIFVTEVANTHKTLNSYQKGEQIACFYKILRDSGRIAGVFSFCASHAQNLWAEQLWTENDGTVKEIASGFADNFSQPVILQVPSHSQLGGQYKNKCGAACLLMVADYLRTVHGYSPLGYTTDKVKILANGESGANDYTSISMMLNAGKALNIQFRWSKNLTLENIRKYIDSGKPVVALVIYRHFKNNTSSFAGGHFVVVRGYDSGQYLVNDPLVGERWVTGGELQNAMADTSTRFFSIPFQGLVC